MISFLPNDETAETGYFQRLAVGNGILDDKKLGECMRRLPFLMLVFFLYGCSVHGMFVKRNGLASYRAAASAPESSR